MAGEELRLGTAAIYMPTHYRQYNILCKATLYIYYPNYMPTSDKQVDLISAPKSAGKGPPQQL